MNIHHIPQNTLACSFLHHHCLIWVAVLIENMSETLHARFDEILRKMQAGARVILFEKSVYVKAALARDLY